MENSSEFATILEENLSPSYFRTNSCTGSSIEVKGQVGERPMKGDSVDDRPTITTGTTKKIEKELGGSGLYNCI